jgi:drug/metabolite transporter (DMT)-like permease
VAVVFFAGFGLALMLHEGAAMLTGAEGGPHWVRALGGAVMVLVMAVMMMLRLRRPNQRLWAFLLCLMFTAIAVIANYYALTPSEWVGEQGVSIGGLHWSFTMKAPSEGPPSRLVVYGLALAFNAVAVLLWISWLRRDLGTSHRR